MAGYNFDKGRKRQKLNTFETAETMPSQNRLALEHMLEYEDEPSEEFRSSLAALPVDLVSDPNQFPIYKIKTNFLFTNADRATIAIPTTMQTKNKAQKDGYNSVMSSQKTF